MENEVERDDEFEASTIVRIDAEQAAAIVSTLQKGGRFPRVDFWEYLLKSGNLDKNPAFKAFLSAHNLRSEDAAGKRRLRVYEGGAKQPRFELKSESLDASIGNVKIADCREVRLPVDRGDKALMGILVPKMIAGITSRTRFDCQGVLGPAKVHIDVFRNLADANATTLLKTDIEFGSKEELVAAMADIYLQREEYFRVIARAMGIDVELFQEGRRESQTDFAKVQWAALGKNLPHRNPKNILFAS